MTATDELRRLLDGRGVEYKDRNVFGKHVFRWGKPFHGAMFTDSGEWTELVVENATPAQAVEATLGRGTCSLVREYFGRCGNRYRLVCSECHHIIYDGWQEKPRYCPFCGLKVVDA